MKAGDGIEGQREYDGPHDGRREAHQGKGVERHRARSEESRGQQDDGRHGEADQDLTAIKEFEKDKPQDTADRHQPPEPGYRPRAP